MAILMGLRDGDGNQDNSWPFKFKLDVKVPETVIYALYDIFEKGLRPSSDVVLLPCRT